MSLFLSFNKSQFVFSSLFLDDGVINESLMRVKGIIDKGEVYIASNSINIDYATSIYQL